MKKSDRHLIARSLDGDLRAAELARLERLLAASPEARADRDAMTEARTSVTALSEEMGYAPGFTDRVMRRVRAMESERASRSSFADWIAWARSHALATASALALGLVVVAVGFLVWSRPVEIEVRYGDLRLVVLPDGSRVELGSGSSLTYGRFRRSAARRVRLTGEAYFTVPQDGRDFVVETFNARVSVTGTAFNVRAWPDEPEAETTVTVAEGEVLVRSMGSETSRAAAQAETWLPAGQMASIRGAQGIVARPVELPLATALAWRTGGISIVNRPLAAALADLQRRFDTRIQLAEPGLGLERVTYLQPQPRSLTDVLTDICFSKNLQFRPIRGGYEVLSAN